MTEPQALPLPALAPHLICGGAAAAIDFYTAAFGATERTRLPAPDGTLMHAALSLNGATLLLVDENREWGTKSPLTLGGTPVTLHLYVDDVDAWMARAVAAGATMTMPVTDMFWGDRYGQVTDPFGHHWSLATPNRAPMTSEELVAAMRGA